ncbi:MAG: hypothetical protein PUE90_05025 [Bacteroidales bacterium]|nr:hypothetical protein [Bacteroidales bacterium]MDD6669292.1 hypothetical protein [Bacteroidales bacterium]
MKRIIAITLLLICICCAINAETLIFRNNVLEITNTSPDCNYVGKSAVALYNKTNNKMRVTYKVTGNIYCVLNGNSYNFKDWVLTTYLEPNDVKCNSLIDYNGFKNPLWDFYQNEIRRYNNNLPDDKIRVNISKVELVNYGIEKVNYETNY